MAGDFSGGGPVAPVVSPLVGREAELATLYGLVHALADGRGGAALVIGEPGIGKSALVGAAVDRAVHAGCAVYWGAADELGEAFPLLPFLSALGVRSAPDERRAAIARLLREGLAAPGTNAVNAASEQLLALVDDLCAESAAIVCIDDLHWADPPSVRLWHELTRSLHQLPLLLLATARPVPVRPDISALRRALRAARWPVMELGPLSASATTELVSQLAGGTPGPRLVELASQTGGNPLYVSELVAALDRAGRLVRHGETSEASGPEVPRSLTEAIEDRLAFLRPEALSALRKAALLGVEFRLVELSVAACLPIGELAALLQEAVQAGVLAESDRGMAFRHPLIRHALYQQMSPSIRRAWHRDLARSLARARTPPSQVIPHLLAALGGDGTEGLAELVLEDWPLDWLVDNGAVAINQTPNAVEDLLRRVTGAMPGNDPRRLRLAAVRAEALYRLGQSEAAIQAAHQVLATAPPSTDPVLLGELVMAYGHSALESPQGYVGLDRVVEILEEHLARPGYAPEHYARMHILLARAQIAPAHWEEAVRAYQRGVELGREIGDRHAIGWGLAGLGYDAWEREGHPNEALALFDEAVQVLDGDPALTHVWLRAKINRTGVLTTLGRYAEGRREIVECQQAAERFGNNRMRAQAHYFDCLLSYASGRWDEVITAAELVCAARDYFPQVDPPALAAAVCLHRDNPTAADRWLRLADEAKHAMAAFVPEYPWLRMAIALAHEVRGDPAAAMVELRAGVDELDFGSIRAAGYGADLLTALVRTAMSIGDHETAVKATQAFDCFAIDRATKVRFCHLYCQGMVNRDPQPLAQVAGEHRRTGTPLELAYAVEALAEVHAEAGHLDRARPLMVEALETYQGLGASWDVNRVRKLFRAYGFRTSAHASTRRAERGWDSLSPTEVRIATMVAQGLSNPQIGERLFLSRRTVQTHVSHILTKFDLHSRVEIARLVTQRTAG